ncbi:hypothetical protein EDI_167760 [Entamoeba dispar SAW760]|uniref:Uncharacterized protein n=1 Tax=Entamoeba dispar (strain ATCC PRA-260 / SAW760) TaxID=370354 RepID=B0EP41_ENTDS|nr:uncharacterized protein EDI_167760 [Entamoeba dispar SAW760]EDR23716.1 hypothetical protein EDI_167760 [Entamoeba dispar SAW760]|eukprot:EDR23716.1 hypothetical protein EDI_167760 [Entamoeba dispar SAW760]
MQEENTIINTLQTLTSPCDSQTRQSAEHVLLNSLPQSIPVLLNISLSNSVDPNQRLLAAIVCKNNLVTNQLPQQDIAACVNQVLPQIHTCPQRIGTMLSFFLEALTRNDKVSRLALINESIRRLPASLPVLDALLCYSFIDRSILNSLCSKNGGCADLIQLIQTQTNPSAMKIIGSIISFIGMDCPEYLNNEVFQHLPDALESILNSESIPAWYHALSLIRLLCSDAPELISKYFTKLLPCILMVIQKIIQQQQNNQWQSLEIVNDLSFDIKDGVLIVLVDVLSAFAALDWYHKYNIEKVNDIVTFVVRIMCSQVQDWSFPFDTLSHNSAQNVLQTSSTTLPEAGIIFFHNIILHQIVPVNVLFMSSFQLLEQGEQLLILHKRNFVNIRGTGLLILSICANYLTKAHIPMQKEVNSIIINVVKNDFQLIGMMNNEDFVDHDICYALTCISSVLPSATYSDLAFFLTALSNAFNKFIYCPIVLPYFLRLLTHCLSIQDFTISPFYTSFFSALLNSLSVSSDELPFVLDALSAYCRYLPPAGTLFQPLVASLLRCFLHNPLSPKVRNSMIQIFTTLFNNRAIFLKVVEFLFSPLPTIYAFCSRQSSDYPTQTILMVSKVIVKYSMALGDELKKLLLLSLSAGKATSQCLELSIDIMIETLRKYVNIMETDDGQNIVSLMLQNLDEAVKIGLMEEEYLLKKACEALMLLGMFHGNKIGQEIVQIAARGNGKGNSDLEIVLARAFISCKEIKTKLTQYLPELFKNAVKMHEMVKEKGTYQGKIHGMYEAQLIDFEEVDNLRDEKGVPLTILSLLSLYLDLIGMEQIYINEKNTMEQSRANGMNEMSGDEDSWFSDEDIDMYTLGEDYMEMSEALQNKELDMLSRDELFYSSYKDFLQNFFNHFKNDCSKQRFLRIQQSALNYNKSLYEFLSK